VRITSRLLTNFQHTLSITLYMSSKLTKRSKGRRSKLSRPMIPRGPAPFVAVPDLDASLVMRKKIRYTPITTTFSITLTNQMVAEFLAINTDNVGTLTYRYALAVRIVKISIYAHSTGASATAAAIAGNHSIQYISSSATAPFGGPSKKLSCTSVFPGNSSVHAKPPLESYAAQWINCQNNVLAGAVDLVTITTSVGDIVDITYEFVANTTSTQTLVSIASPAVYGTIFPPIYAQAYGGVGAGLIPQNFSPFD